MTLISIVMTVYYNAPTLPELFRRLRAVADELAPLDFEFICVDDRSGDESFQIIEAEGRCDPRIRGIRLSRNFGANPALVAGLSYACGEYVVSMSSDLQDPPEMIPRMVEAWRRGNEVVLAAREGREDPLATRLFGTAFNRLFRTLVFPDYPKDGFDFMGMDRRVAKRIANMREKNSHTPGQVFWLGFRREIIYYRRQARAAGRSRWTFAKKVKFFVDAFAAFSYLPLRLAGLAGILLAALGFIYAVSVVVSRLTGLITEPPGFAGLMVAVLVIGGTQLVVTAMIGEYIWRVLEESRARPLFVIDSTVNAEFPDTVDHESRAIYGSTLARTGETRAE